MRCATGQSVVGWGGQARVSRGAYVVQAMPPHLFLIPIPITTRVLRSGLRVSVNSRAPVRNSVYMNSNNHSEPPHYSAAVRPSPGEFAPAVRPSPIAQVSKAQGPVLQKLSYDDFLHCLATFLLGQ